MWVLPTSTGACGSGSAESGRPAPALQGAARSSRRSACRSTARALLLAHLVFQYCAVDVDAVHRSSWSVPGVGPLPMGVSEAVTAVTSTVTARWRLDLVRSLCDRCRTMTDAVGEAVLQRARDAAARGDRKATFEQFTRADADGLAAPMRPTTPARTPAPTDAEVQPGHLTPADVDLCEPSAARARDDRITRTRHSLQGAGVTRPATGTPTHRRSPGAPRVPCRPTPDSALAEGRVSRDGSCACASSGAERVTPDLRDARKQAEAVAQVRPPPSVPGASVIRVARQSGPVRDCAPGRAAGHDQVARRFSQVLLRPEPSEDS